MSDPFRRVRPGEAVRIQAVAWNALLDLVRPKGGTQNTISTQQQLPAETICCVPAFSGQRRPVFGEVVRLVASTSGATAAATVPLPPAANTTPPTPMVTLTDTERRLVAGYRPRYAMLAPNDAGASLEDPLAVCLDGTQLRFAIRGLVWVRVRALRGWHGFARRCLPQPGDGAPELAASVGCLDSCGWGPIEIIGWAPADFDPQRNGEQLRSTQRAVSTAAGGIGWALVRL